MKRNTVISAIAVAALLAATWLLWHNRPLPDHLTARVNDVEFPRASVEVLWRSAKQARPEVTLEQVVRGAIENHLIATGMDRFQGESHHRERGSGRVGYDPQTRTENELFRVLRSAFRDQIGAGLAEAGAESPTDFLTDEPQLDPQALAPALRVEQGLYHQMTDEQRELAADVVLGHYRFPGGEEQAITLLDIYQRQNIQLKVQMHNMNLGFIREAINQFLATRYVLHWFEHQSPLSADEVAAVKRMVAERLEKEEQLHRIGLMADIHDDNEALKAVAANVSAEEIRDFYEQHREEFTRVERVRARHIRLSGQSQADTVYRRLQQGMAFEEAVRTWSEADDRNAEIPGDLGWIDRDERHDNWLRGIAFVQPEGRFSPPFRSPEQGDDEVYWEIIYVDEKETGYQPADSEGVRYEASRAIAREKVERRYHNLLENLREDADIRINKAVLSS